MYEKEKSMEDIKKQIEKVVINAGIGRASQQAQFEDKILPEIEKDFAAITGQKPSERKAKKSIAGFKTRTGQIVGLTATLRGARMVDFFERLVNLALPRVKDFRGLTLSNVDANGNLNIGLREQTVFPEIDLEKTKVTFGIQVTVVPKEKNRDSAIDFYRRSGVPLKK